MRQAGEAGARAFVGLGSQAEYGPYDEPLREDLTPRPISLYGIAKLATADLTRSMCSSYGMRWVWLRLTAAYGPMDDRAHLLPSVIQDLLAAQTSVRLRRHAGVGLPVRRGRRRGCPLGRRLRMRAEGVLNLSAVDAWTVRALVEEVRDLIDPELQIGFGEQAPVRSRRCAATRAACAGLTGWEPKVALPEGLRATVEWEREYAR